MGSDKLVRSLWYTFGLASVLLITENPELNKELLNQAQSDPKDVEIWQVRKGRIINISIKASGKQDYDQELLRVPDYSRLPVVERAIVDELVSSIALIAPKVAAHIPSVYDAFPHLIGEMSKLVTELVYLSDPKGPPPATLDGFSEEFLQTDRSLCERIRRQAVDRLIQVNSSLSYVSTQMLSGAVPILERRSLIRRHSLLGISSAILTLTRISRSIEFAFSQFSMEDIIVERMAHAKPLPGLENLPHYDASEWGEEYSVNCWDGKVPSRTPYPKLPYFSGRLGFRETEYAISAALESLTTGTSLEWSLLTITHELLHGYVRNILSLLFLGDPKKPDKDNWAEFYQCYTEIVQKGRPADNELESLRSAILTYCCLTYTFGSLTKKEDDLQIQNTTQASGKVVRQLTEDFYLLTQSQLWTQYEEECRNISEIFVHVLDLHYFYATRLSAYIPLIWRTWAELPHVNADLRQYILRSLLSISTKVPGSPYERFHTSIDRLNELLGQHIDGALNVSAVHEVRKHLNDEKSREALFYPFWASLILVDLANKIFVSKGIRNKLFNDLLVRWLEDEEGFEEKFEYMLPEGFSQETVRKPAVFLLDRLLRQLKQPQSSVNIEAETAKLFLACCSSLEVQ